MAIRRQADTKALGKLKYVRSEETPVRDSPLGSLGEHLRFEGLDYGVREIFPSKTGKFLGELEHPWFVQCHGLQGAPQISE
jgi:hypothetical protein